VFLYRSLARLSAVACLTTLLFTLPAVALAPAVHHPLDALTPDEYWAVYRVLRAAGHVQESTIFTSVLFHEPPKKEVLSWRPGEPISRKADVVLFDNGKSYAAVVDIGAQKVESYSELKDAQAPLTDDERHAVEDAVKKDPRIVEALKKRGITDLKVVTCYVEPAGYVALPEQEGNKRIGWGKACSACSTAFVMRSEQNTRMH